jgi:hypothetical protein
MLPNKIWTRLALSCLTAAISLASTGCPEHADPSPTASDTFNDPTVGAATSGQQTSATSGGQTTSAEASSSETTGTSMCCSCPTYFQSFGACNACSAPAIDAYEQCACVRECADACGDNFCVNLVYTQACADCFNSTCQDAILTCDEN